MSYNNLKNDQWNILRIINKQKTFLYVLIIYLYQILNLLNELIINFK